MFIKIVPEKEDTSSSKNSYKKVVEFIEPEETEYTRYAKQCVHCGKERKILRRWVTDDEDETAHRTANLTSVCTNPECGYHIDIAKLKDWRPEVKL